MKSNLLNLDLKENTRFSIYIIASIFKNGVLFTLNNETQSYLIFIFRNKNKTNHT